MSILYRCDRCGKTSETDRREINDMTIKHALSRSKPLDICTDCFRALAESIKRWASNDKNETDYLRI